MSDYILNENIIILSKVLKLCALRNTDGLRKGGAFVVHCFVCLSDLEVLLTEGFFYNFIVLQASRIFGLRLTLHHFLCDAAAVTTSRTLLF